MDTVQTILPSEAKETFQPSDKITLLLKPFSIVGENGRIT